MAIYRKRRRATWSTAEFLKLSILSSVTSRFRGPAVVGARSVVSAIPVQASQVPSWRKSAPAGKTLAQAQLEAVGNANQDRTAAQLADLSPSLAQVLRPQASFRWLLPYLSAITPQYIEAVLRGALAGNHVQAWELFDLMPDTSPDIAACMGEYLDGVRSKRFLCSPYCDEDSEPSPEAIEKAKLVRYALRNMRPATDADENDFSGTIRDILAARFHGQSVLEIDWMDGYQSKKLNLRSVPGLSGNPLFGKQALVPRSTYWVHPCCYAWDMSGRLGLRMALVNPDGTPNDPLVKAGTKWGQQTKMGKQAGSMIEPPVWNFISSQPMPSILATFPPDKFLIGVMKAKTGSVLGGSCLRSLAWWWCAANFSFDYLLNLAQLFGIPFRKATFKPGTSEPTKQEVRAMLQQCGSTGWSLLPDSITMEFESATGSAGQSPQAFFAKLAEDMIRKVILRQTMTGGSTSGGDKGVGKSFGEVEQGVKEQCIQAGADYACSVINQQLVPSILLRNYGDDGDSECPTVALVDDDQGDLTDAQTLTAISALVDVPDSYVRRMFRIPKLGTDDKVCGVETGTAGQALQQGQQQQDQFIQGQDQEDDETDDGETDDGETEARNAIESANATPDPNLTAVTEALHETVAPILQRLEAIQRVGDPDTRKALLQKFIDDHTEMAEAVAQDRSLAKALEQAGVKQFVDGVKGAKVQARDEFVIHNAKKFPIRVESIEHTK